jgi:hypothetical protein|tara:strand:+ start:1269 stop:1403 length:135 start_codon:yes stop_codon:yes gene_type:complete
VHHRIVQLEVNAHPKHDLNSEVVGVVCIGEDVKDRRRMLQAISP